jgi:hypothetical protein
MMKKTGKSLSCLLIGIFLLTNSSYAFNHISEDDLENNSTASEVQVAYQEANAESTSNDDDWGEAISACGIAPENRTEGDVIFSSGVGIIRTQSDTKDYLNARIIAFKKAFISAKRQMVESIKIKIATETSFTYSEGQKLTKEIPQENNEKGMLDKLQLLANSYLDEQLEEKGIDPDKDIPDEAIKEILISEEFQQKIEAVAQMAVSGVTVIEYTNEKCKDNNKEVIIAETVWSPKLRQLAQAITSGDPSLTPKGIKKTTIESQLKAFNLKDYMGVIMLTDENGDGNLVSVGQAVSVGSGNAAMAVEKAQINAEAQIRQFMGEYLSTGKLLDQAESYKEFEDMSQEYTYDENTVISVNSVSEAMNLQGVRRVGSPIEIFHKPSNKKLFIVTVKWSPASLAAAKNAERLINDTSGSSSSSSNEDNDDLNVTNDDSSYSSGSGTGSAADFWNKKNTS